MLIPLSEKEFFTEIQTKNQIYVLYFGASWCGVCQVVKPVIEKLESLKLENVKVYQVDVDTNPLLLEKCGVTSIPTTIVIKNQQILNKEIGYRSIENFIKIIEEAKK